MKRLERCWLRMLETKCVDDVFISPTSFRLLINFTSPASLFHQCHCSHELTLNPKKPDKYSKPSKPNKKPSNNYNGKNNNDYNQSSESTKRPERPQRPNTYGKIRTPQ